MKIFDCIQGSPEWFAARLGVPTASNFDKIVTTKGEPSKSAQKYMYKLAGEKASGIAEESYQNAAMARGTELEAEARKFYEMVKNVEVEEVGFCLLEDKGYGASPDGLVRNKGLVEIKCPLCATHVGYLLKETLLTDYFQQVQGQMLVTGREWTDLISYYPGLKPLIIHVERDDAFLNKLEAELDKFVFELNDVIRTIK